MKRDYLNWNRDTVNDIIILEDLRKISGGTLSLPADTKLIPTNEIVNKGMQAQQPKKKQATKQKNAKAQAKQSNPNRPNKK